MPDRFGGIPIDEQGTSRDKFGGVPLEEEAPSSWSAQAKPTKPPRVGGQKVLDYTTETLSNVPSSAAKLAGNIGSAIAHPIDTAAGVGKIATGTLQAMTPGYVTKDRPGYSKEAGAAWDAAKARYGSPAAIAESIRTDPIGVASDVSALAGGVSGIARGVAAVAPRAAGTAGSIARGAATVSDVTNPVNLVAKPAGAALKSVAKPFVKSALDLRGKTERYGATPATAALEETSGVTPEAVRASAVAKLNELHGQLDNLAIEAERQGNTGEITAARAVVQRKIDEVKAANGLPDDFAPMLSQLTMPRPGFTGAVEQPPGAPAPVISPRQPPTELLKMKRQFGDDYTKFDATVPLRDTVRKTGNEAYHELSQSFNAAVPGAQPINQRIQSLVPVKEAAQRAAERIGPMERTLDRATRPTGGLAAILMGLHAGGPGGAALAAALQEGLASPTVKMAIARALYASGKAAKHPLTARILNALGVEGEAASSIPPPLDTPQF